MDNKDTGLLLNKQNIQLHRIYFKQMTKLIGINALYRAPLDTKDYDMYGELDANYYPPIQVGVIYEDHPTQKTAKKMGWNAELNDGSTLIVVPYDLPKLQKGSLFIIPSGLDNSEGRVFRVIQMKVTAIYPSEITCELAPVLKNELERSQVTDYSKSNFNVLNDEEEED